MLILFYFYTGVYGMTIFQRHLCNNFGLECKWSFVCIIVLVMNTKKCPALRWHPIFKLLYLLLLTSKYLKSIRWCWNTYQWWVQETHKSRGVGWCVGLCQSSVYLQNIQKYKLRILYLFFSFSIPAHSLAISLIIYCNRMQDFHSMLPLSSSLLLFIH